ncbi:uncharacterized protein FFMR_12540 [Fusarium fujikuroi]|nr:uncharacterized protein FFMR_12540 [Fusarium fujikuroi]
MDRIRSYKDLKPPFNNGRFPLYDAPLKPLETASRRSHLEKYIVRVMPSFSKFIDVEWKKAESKICENLASERYMSVSEPWFEYQVDRIVYLHFFATFKAFFDRDVPGLPWEDITDKYLKSQQDKNSSVYVEYLKRQESQAQKSNPVEKSTLAQDTNEMGNVEGPATERRVLTSSKLNPRALEFRPPQDGGRRQTTGEPSGRAWVATRSGKRGKRPVNRRGKQEGDVDMDTGNMARLAM